MKFLLLLLPTLILGTVDVQFSGTIDFNGGRVRGVFDATNYAKFKGRSFTDEDRNSFYIDAEVLKNAVEKSNGKRPDEVYLTSPKNYSNLYEENGFKEVKSRIVPIEVNAIQVKSKETLLTKKPFDNYNDVRPKKAVIDVSLMVQHKLSSNWKNGENTVGDKVHLNMKFRINCEKIEIDHTFDWGEKKHTRASKLLQENEETVIIPGKEKIAELHAKIGLVQFAIDYNISLTGDVVAVYNDVYKGKRYHTIDIVNIMTAKELSSSKIATQIVTYQFYYGTFLKIVDSKPKLSQKPIAADFKDRNEIVKSQVKGLGNIRMASKSELEKYILSDIDEDMYTGLKSETCDNQSNSSEESVEN